MTHPFVFLEWLTQQLHLHIGTHVTYTWLVMALLIIIAFLVKSSIKTVPTGLQNFFRADNRQHRKYDSKRPWAPREKPISP